MDRIAQLNENNLESEEEKELKNTPDAEEKAITDQPSKEIRPGNDSQAEEAEGQSYKDKAEEAVKAKN